MPESHLLRVYPQGFAERAEGLTKEHWWTMMMMTMMTMTMATMMMMMMINMKIKKISMYMLKSPGTGMKPWPSLSKTLKASRISSSMSLSCISLFLFGLVRKEYFQNLTQPVNIILPSNSISGEIISRFILIATSEQGGSTSVEFWSLISLFRRWQYFNALRCAMNTVVTNKI